LYAYGIACCVTHLYDLNFIQLDAMRVKAPFSTRLYFDSSCLVLEHTN
jgi:hypothetical protein